MSVHVAILQKPYLDAVLAGAKTVESRLTKTARPPYDAIATGERIYFKQSGGRVRATALVGRVDSFSDLDPAGVEQLRRRYQASVGGDDAYWASKRDARFAVFVGLAEVEPMEHCPAYKPAYLRAWYVLPDVADVIRDFPLTEGAIRNRYATLPGNSERYRNFGVTLILPDGQEVQTSLGASRRLRWRGWGSVYTEQRVRPGDRLRFVAAGGGRFEVRFPDSDRRRATKSA